MKKVRDYYFKKAKQEKYPARSVFKLEEAQKRFKVLKKGDTVLDLGCSPGSWSIYAAKQIGPSGRVVGVDLHTTHKYAFAGAAPMELLKADIYSEEIFSQLASIRFNVVLSDMAPATTGHKFSDHLRSLELSRRALEIAEAVLAEGGNFYCKVFQGEDFSEYVDEVRKSFKKVKVVKPKSSRLESREVFVLAMHFKQKRSG
ncbi:MAG: RlmE family RNA methyltransferase [Thermodesulfobacteriota bacterium]